MFMLGMPFDAHSSLKSRETRRRSIACQISNPSTPYEGRSRGAQQTYRLYRATSLHKVVEEVRVSILVAGGGEVVVGV